MTLLEHLRRGHTPPLLTDTATREGRPASDLAADILAGHTVLPGNATFTLDRPAAIGRHLRTKVNANLGTSPDHDDVTAELEKMCISLRYGADAIMDLSTGGDIPATRRRIREACPAPLGTVPVYEAAAQAQAARGEFTAFTADDLFAVIDTHGREGVDFITVHCGATRAVADTMRAQGRVLDMVSRGGALLVEWMTRHDQENPLFAQYDRLLEIARRHDMTLSLGDAFRPGCLADATDRAQLGELLVLGDLARRARAAGVQVMIEGPGHVPLNQIAENIRVQKAACDGAPFYVLGPLVTDLAAGYDHIAAAIGGAVAAMHGADFLCYVTPAEHLRLPTVADVRQGVVASRIAAHAADIAKGLPGAMDPDTATARARRALDWEGQFAHLLDPDMARQMRGERPPADAQVCTMCGSFCAIRSSNAAFGHAGR